MSASARSELSSDSFNTPVRREAPLAGASHTHYNLRPVEREDFLAAGRLVVERQPTSRTRSNPDGRSFKMSDEREFHHKGHGSEPAASDESTEDFEAHMHHKGHGS